MENPPDINRQGIALSIINEVFLAGNQAKGHYVIKMPSP